MLWAVIGECPFAAEPDLGIVGGVLTPVCQRRPSAAGFFQFFQTFEYARGFLWRLTWTQLRHARADLRRVRGLPAHQVLEAAGGFDTIQSWVEDYELTHRVYRDALRPRRACARGRRSPVRARNDRCAGHGANFCFNQRRRLVRRASSPRTSNITRWWRTAKLRGGVGALHALPEDARFAAANLRADCCRGPGDAVGRSGTGSRRSW